MWLILPVQANTALDRRIRLTVVTLPEKLTPFPPEKQGQRFVLPFYRNTPPSPAGPVAPQQAPPQGCRVPPSPATPMSQTTFMNGLRH
ncbi:hypothetical protein GCM10008938_07150 [Deinococcus roseus]|uniref:Uncharacterized protein n=1 Tax=Deinococcus roseus TaxID=392414 RepID=A0ABQ2CXJ6_9DEIO|nr:hypothetical protein GCM10008938_07150 [Deinococcus roseus]